MPLTKGQQRTLPPGGMAPTSPLPHMRVCWAGWLPITPWPVCTLPDWTEWRRTLPSSTPCPGSLFSSALDMAGPNPLGEAPKQPSPTTLIWLNSCSPLRLGLDSVKLRIY